MKKQLDLFDHDLFLFDFDGLLVDTEPLHYTAYAKALEGYGITSFWPYGLYCRYAHLGTHGTAIYEHFPALKEIEPDWDKIREKKMGYYREAIGQKPIELMPGALTLLELLEKLDKPSCVVTNSYREDVDAIRKKIPELALIPYWLTRDDYAESKPSPAGYLKARALYGKKARHCIGFEDTLKGLSALHQAQVSPILICPREHPQLREKVSFPFAHFESLTSAYSR